MMRARRYQIVQLAASLFLAVNGISALAADETATSPTTRPAPLLPVKLLVLPFENLNNASPDSWTAAAAQRSLVGELASVANLTTEMGEAVAADAGAAIAIGQQHGARYVLRGSLQALPSQLRFTGEVLDVPAGQRLASLKATGTVDDLFDLEDTLVRQARWAFRPSIAAASQSNVRAEAVKTPQLGIAPGGSLRLDGGNRQGAAAVSSSSGLAAYYQSASANERFSTQYNRYKTAMPADLGFGYGYGYGYWGYPYYGFGYGYGFGTYGVSIYGTSHH